MPSACASVKACNGLSALINGGSPCGLLIYIALRWRRVKLKRNRNLITSKLKLFSQILVTGVLKKPSLSRGAEVTYYLVLSLFPFMITFLNVLKFTPLAQEDVLDSLLQYTPEAIGQFIKATVLEAMTMGSDTLLSLGALAGLWAASKGIKSLIKALNEAYEFEENRSFIQLSLFSLALTIGFIVLTILVLWFFVFADALNNLLLIYFGFNMENIFFTGLARKFILIGILIFFFTLLYKFSPAYNASNIKWRYALPGAVFSALVWLLMSAAFSFYINNYADYARSYGSLWTTVILLIWLQLSATVVILGGEINAALRKMSIEE